METMKRRPRRSFTPEFKAEVVELCRQQDRTISQVARDLGLFDSTVRNWCNQADIDEGRRDGLTTADREEITRLRKENRRLTLERDVLKRATVFFATETR